MSVPDSLKTVNPVVAPDTVHHHTAGVQDSVRIDSIHSVTGEVADSSATKENVPARPVYRIPVARIPADSIAADSVAGDSVHSAHSFGILLSAPVRPEVNMRQTSQTGMSIIVASLLVLFCIIGIRFHNSRKYVTALLRNLVEVRLRSNVFDETVRETSFLVLLNLMWSCSAGVLLYGLLCLTAPSNPEFTSGVRALLTDHAASLGVCIGVGIVYTGFMALAYFMVGGVFSDGVHARMWLKGYAASQGLLSFIYLPLALLMICWHEWTEILLWIALGTFILSKIVFIWKGFRIFFTQISSWLLFLYYLCSLEIVPLILTYLAALWICGFLD